MRHLVPLLLLTTLLPTALPAAEPAPPPPWQQQVDAERAAAAQAFRANHADEALQHLQLAIAAAEQGGAPAEPRLAKLLADLGSAHTALGHLPQADAVFTRALALTERLTGPTSVQTGWLLQRRGLVRLRQGRAPEAVADLERALAIHDAQATVGLNERLNLLESLTEAVVKQRMDTARALELGARRLALVQQVPNPGERAWYQAKIHADLAVVHGVRGEWDAEAADLDQGLREVVELSEPNRAPVEFRLLDLRCGLAVMRDPRHAEALCRQALERGQNAFERHDVRLSSPLLSLGTLAQQRGAPHEARPLMERALVLLEGHADPLEVAQAQQQLAGLLDKLGQDARAESLYRQSLATFAQALGPDHAATAAGRQVLAHFLHARERDAEALPLLTAALTSMRKSLGPEHVMTAEVESDLGELQSDLGQHTAGLALVQHAVAVTTQKFGAKSGLLLSHLARLGRIELALGHVPQALAATARTEDLRERRVAALLLAGSEAQKRQFLDTLRDKTDGTLSLHLQYASGQAKAAHLALETLLRRKGRLLDALAGAIGALRTRLGPGEARLLDQLPAAQAGLSEPPQDLAKLQAWQQDQARREAEVEALQQQVSDQSAALREAVQPVTVEQVRALLPDGAALLEYAQYQPLVPGPHGAMTGLAAPRYAAWVLTKPGDVHGVDLGPAAAIDAQVEQVRAALADPRRGDAKDLARALDERILGPLRPFLKQSTHLLVAPDGQLNLVPFAALVDEQGRWAVERWTISALASGRDLVRLQDTRPARGPAVVVANPAFGEGTGFAALPGAQAEGRLLAPLLPHATLWTGTQATEAALAGLHAPVVLHLATHGYFLGDVATGEGNPLLRSGLALAGANAGTQDGRLTALEAAGLDLWGTQLVVLSACETAVGRVHTGEGVYGLRRALALAGARTQVMSLWKVDDEATRDLMVDLYRRLGKGQGRAEALRQAQRAMLASAGKGGKADRGAQALGDDGQAGPPDLGRAHPYYWAAFLVAGDWTPMRLQP